MGAVQDVLAQDGLLRIAHRGASETSPENTIHAFRQAIADGADMIELDVRLTKDGSLVIVHDEYLNRTTSGQGLVCDRHVDEIRRLDAGSWFHPQFAGIRVPGTLVYRRSTSKGISRSDMDGEEPGDARVVDDASGGRRHLGRCEIGARLS
ncbi:glycerophosphodiester phosphodiesterase family protein [Alicyclobacillus fastidiosus]|uniref:glycerophosphodiester phosphodiesterase family protein n=1 Tax=Alicyclobacillus fastidiosus TaxID=392011 RepID=UPI0024E077A6|nr:glycerophosphodiester phosphodiesterase family protein [Alicyclobacillus fastidiosus]